MALMVAMTALVTLAVVFRYLVDASLTWYDEFASYLLVWLSFYGAVVGTYRGRHISFETLAERLGPRARQRIAVVSELCSLAFQAVLLVFGIVLLQAMGHETAVSVDWIPMVWIYSVLPISGGLMLLISLTRLVLVLRGESGVLAGPRHAPTAASSE